MRCPQCTHESGETARFCEQCGTRLIAECPHCQARLSPSAKFCDACGRPVSAPAPQPVLAPAAPPSPVAPGGERRHATVMFSDLSGYTAMNERMDPEEVEGIMSRIKAEAVRIVESHGGIVTQFVGDEVLALFGIPTAHQDDPIRAVRAARELHALVGGINPEVAQKIGQPLLMHTGINTGLIVTNSRDQRDGTIGITGDTVNTGARLRAQAEWDHILVSPETQREIEGFFETEALEPVEMRGKAEPMIPHRITGEIATPTREVLPLVGRGEQVARFNEVLETGLATGAGATVYVRGEPGIGKTRLVSEFQAIGAARGFACHRALVLDFGSGVGRDAVHDLVESLLELSPGGSQQARQQAAAKCLAEGLLAAEQEMFLCDLLELPQQGEMRGLFDAIDNETRRRGRRDSVATLVGAISRRQPLLLVVEDIHWAEAETLYHLRALIQTVAGTPALLLMTSRLTGDPLGAELEAEQNGSGVLKFDLHPLPRQEALALAEKFLNVSGQFALSCVQRAEGNPLFLEQLLRSAETTQDEGVPGSVQTIVLMRVDRLDPLDKKAIQAAAVIGQRFNLAQVRELVENPAYSCQGLLAHHVVKPEGADFLFSHALIREGVYNSLLKSRRRALHTLAAAWFEHRDPILWAQHLDRAEDARAPKAYLKAAASLRAHYRQEKALELVTRGLELAQEKMDLFDLTASKGYLLYDLGRIAPSIQAFEQALAAAPNDEQKAQAWIGQAVGLRVNDNYQEGLAVLEQAEKAAAGKNLILDLAQLHYLRGNLYFPLGRTEDCLREHERALAYAQEAGSVEYQARVASGLGDAQYLRGRMRTAHDHFRRCVALSREQGFGRIEVANLHMCGWAGIYLLPVEQALEAALAAAEKAKRVNHPRAELLAHLLVGYTKTVLTGDLAGAREHLNRALELGQKLKTKRFLANTLNTQGCLARANGDRPEAVRLIRESLEISREAGMKFLGPTILGNLAEVVDDPATREEALAEALEILATGPVGHNFFWFYRDAMELMLRLEDWERVGFFADALEAYTRPEPLPWSDFFVARGRTLAAHGAGRRGPAVREQLASLRVEGEKMGWLLALPALQQALAVV